MDNKTKILFVDDESNVLSGLRRMLRGCRGQWQMHFANGGQEALKLVSEQEIDVLVTDMKMPEVDGAALLTEVSKSNPEIVRIILSGQAEKEKILDVVGIAHQFLSKPCDSEMLQATISRICNAQSQLEHHDLKGVVTQIGHVPCLRQNYAELTEAFDAGKTEFERIKRIVNRDIGLSAKILQLVSSSFFGTPQPKCSVATACDMLGFDLLSQLFFDSSVFQPMESESIGSMSFTDLYDHSFQVAELAAKIVATNDCTPETHAVARNAALFHDIGRLVLARYFPESYIDALKLAQQETTSLKAAEQEIFNSTHTQVGAFLLALWGIDADIVDAVCAFSGCEQLNETEFSPVTAVFAANQLIKENNKHSSISPLEESQYLRQVGCSDQLPQWRSLVGAE